MKFKYIGPNIIDNRGNEHPAGVYGGQKAFNGDTIELTDEFLIKKALSNPHFEQVKAKRKAKKAEKIEDEPIVEETAETSATDL